ncbi:MAG: Era-like GTP-binding protein [Candidatus Micrarchaeota archaeon]|nr:Era-like GTP-binding protein [Candidatus Micrarchaeota archaeon]
MPLDKIFKWLRGLFGNRKSFSLGLYGNPSVGKSTLANRVSKDWTGEEMSEVSEVPHTTRSVVKKERIKLRLNGQELTMNLLDMPGIATKVDYKEFIKYGLKTEEAQQRAKEATRGIIEAIKWLEHVDVALVVMDATQDPYTQVNITILGNLEARGIPVIIVANKMDLKKASGDRIREAFPQHEVVEVSALTGKNVQALYETIAKHAG